MDVNHISTGIKTTIIIRRITFVNKVQQTFNGELFIFLLKITLWPKVTLFVSKVNSPQVNHKIKSMPTDKPTY